MLRYIQLRKLPGGLAIFGRLVSFHAQICTTKFEKSTGGEEPLVIDDKKHDALHKQREITGT